MYIIYNSDGSIEKKSITEYIQQGNSYANVLFVTVKDTDLGDYTASAIVTLPNGQNVGAIIEEAEEPVEIDGVEYDGYYITLDETCTLMAGAIRISLSLTIDETRMVTYPIYLNVNATPYDADAPVMISYNQYLELLASIAECTTPNNPTITLQKNGVTVGYFSLNQASNKTINYVLSKSDVGLGNVDNTSDATKKNNFTGAIVENNTGFATGGAVYSALHGTFTYDLTFGYNNGICLKDQSNNEYKIYANNLGLKLGTNVTVSNSGDISAVGYSLSGYRISAADNVLRIRHYIFDSNNGSAKFYHENSGTGNIEGAADLGTTDNYWKNVYATEYFFKGYTTHSLGYEYNMIYVKTYVNSVSRKYYFAPSQFFPDANNASDLGNSTYKWKDLYLAGTANVKELNFSEGIKTSVINQYHVTYNYHFTTETTNGNLQLNGEDFINHNGDLVRRRIVFGGNWFMAYNNAESGIFAGKLQIYESFLFDKTSGSESFCHLVGTYYGRTYNAADLGTSDCPWKNLYLNGKINDLTLPTGSGTLAKKSDVPFIVEIAYDDTIANAKSKVSNPSENLTFYEYSQATDSFIEKKTELLAGDYDNITLANSDFNSTANTITLSQTGTKYYLFRRSDMNAYILSKDYMVGGAWRGKTMIVVTNEDVPSRAGITGLYKL